MGVESPIQSHPKISTYSNSKLLAIRLAEIVDEDESVHDQIVRTHLVGNTQLNQFEHRIKITVEAVQLSLTIESHEDGEPQFKNRFTQGSQITINMKNRGNPTYSSHSSTATSRDRIAT